MLKKYLISASITFALFTQTGHASDTDLVALSELLTTHKTFSAEFQQYTLSDANTQDELAAGRIWIKQPDKFRWETETPFPQLILSNGDQVWIYDEDLEQVTQRAVGAQTGLTPAVILGGDLDKLRENFDVSLIDASNQTYLYELAPLAQTQVDFQKLRLLFDNQSLRELLIEDSLGQRSLIMFNSVQFPELMDDSLFEFEAPEGVDLLKDLAN